MTVLDHGGLIVAAKDYHQSDRSANLKYSCDEGTTWNDFMYSQHDITIFGVVTEPGETTTIVRYGHVSLFLLLHFLLLLLLLLLLHIDNHHLLLQLVRYRAVQSHRVDCTGDQLHYSIHSRTMSVR